jgi:REP element-mobilizing transposase RayT
VQKCILVTSPHRAFAELLRSSLEECGRYQVEVAYTAQEALAAAQTASFDLVVLDADVEDETLVQTGKRLMALQPDMLLMVIPPDNDPRHLSLNGIQPHSYLERPFYLPDLLTRLDRLFGIDSPGGTGLVPTVHEAGLSGWIRDGQQVSYDLEIMLRDTNFSHALLVQAGRTVGFSVQLDPQDALKLGSWIGQQRSGGHDLARYIRLDARGGEYLLYVTALTGALMLGTISEISLPLTEIRSRTRTLAKNLLTLAYQRDSEALTTRLQADARPAAGSAAVLEEQEDPFSEGELDEGLLIKLDDLLQDMPPPDPGMIIAPSEWEAAGAAEDTVQMPARGDSAVTMELDLVLPWEEELSTPLPPDPTADTRPPSPLDTAAAAGDTNQSVPVFAQIAFTCILIPAHSQHYLVGDLARRVAQWLPQVCGGFGWQLKSMQIEPGYLLWVVEVPPSVSPGSVVRTVRKRTSERIAAQFPDLFEKGKPGDFWAPGYLVASGSQALTDQLVSDFVSQTRRRQGINP